MNAIAVEAPPAARARRVPRSGYVVIDPPYRGLLEVLGLADAADLLALPAVVVSGHPDRNVSRVTLGAGASAVPAFLKREHRRSWKFRLINACAGFGLVSRSHREAVMLRAARRAGIGCPECIAAGEDDAGNAFVLVRELTGAIELRRFLSLPATGRQRRAFARRLGEALARLHAAGFDHPDLYCKHVFVKPDDGTIHFLDWQRSRRSPRLTWRRRLRDLAALDASLAPELATARERLVCLKGYLRADGVRTSALVVRTLRRRSGKLAGRRRARELWHAPPADGAQNLVRLDGDALCVTPEFQAALDGRVPDWLTSVYREPGSQDQVARTVLPVPRLGQAVLVRRRAGHFWRWLWCRLRARPFASPEIERAGLLFRLQRFGVSTPRLCAFGQRFRLPWHTDSFLLFEATPHAMSLSLWLSNERLAGRAVGVGPRRAVLQEAGIALRRLHEAGCSLARKNGRDMGTLLWVRQGPPGAVMLGDPQGVRKHRRLRTRHRRKDLVAVDELFVRSGCSRSDVLRFFLGYLGLPRLTAPAKRLFRQSFPFHGGRP